MLFFAERRQGECGPIRLVAFILAASLSFAGTARPQGKPELQWFGPSAFKLNDSDQGSGNEPRRQEDVLVFVRDHGQSLATSRAPGVRARNSSGASRPASVKAFFTAATLGPKMPLRLSLAHWFELTIVSSEPWKRGIT